MLHVFVVQSFLIILYDMHTAVINNPFPILLVKECIYIYIYNTVAFD